MLSPSNLYPTASGYFFYTSDGRYFNIYFTPYTIEIDQGHNGNSKEYTMIGVEPIANLPEEYINEELNFPNENSQNEIDSAIGTAIRNFFEAFDNEILICLLSMQKGQHKARRRRFKKIINQLGDEISCINYELDEYPDKGFLILANHQDKNDITNFFRQYIDQLLD